MTFNTLTHVPLFKKAVRVEDSTLDKNKNIKKLLKLHINYIYIDSFSPPR